MAQNKQKILKNAAKFTKKGQYEKAVAEYRKLTQEEYGDSSLNNLIGDLLIQCKKTQEAILEYEKAGSFYEEKGFLPKALAIYKKILRYDPKIPRIYEKMAQLYSDQGLIQDAITQYEFLAKHYEIEGKTEEALDAYRQIADLDPSNLSIRERLATLYSQRGFKEKACAERVKIGEKYIKRGDTLTAINNFELALKEVPDNEDALRGIISVYLSEKRTQEAIKILDRILKKDPNNTSALSTLGRVYMDTGQLDEAIEVFKKVNRLDPTQEGINEILGRIYILKGNYTEAFRCLKEIINLAIEREEYDRALTILNQLQEIEPKNIPVREKKIEIYQKLNRDEDLKNTYIDLAEIYYETGRIEEAYNIYERLFSMDPNNTKIKQRFNQISIELRGRPVEIDQLVEQPSFEKVLAEAEMKKDDILELEEEPFSLDDTSSNTLESLFDTTEIEKLSIPVFDESAVSEIEMEEETILADDIFSMEGEEDVSSEKALKETLEPSKDQIREFMIEAGVFMKYGLLDKAVERLKSILVINPDEEEAMEKLTEVYEKLGQTGLMVQMLIKRADLAKDTGDFHQAADLLRQALDAAPGTETVLRRLKNLRASVDIPWLDEIEPVATIDEEIAVASDFEPLVDLKEKSLDIDFPPGGDMESLVDLSAETVALEESEKEKQEAKLSNGLAEVVKEFREELISRPDSRDVETHYNLGIAYMEMGLLDEAIEEFKLAIDFPEYTAKSSDLLASCYLQKGEAQKAIPILSRALKMENITDNEKLTLTYDLALARQHSGDLNRALELFEEIQKKNGNYRNVPDLIKELKKGG